MHIGGGDRCKRRRWREKPRGRPIGEKGATKLFLKLGKFEDREKRGRDGREERTSPESAAAPVGRLVDGNSELEEGFPILLN